MYWFARKRTSAWATVSLMLGLLAAVIGSRGSTSWPAQVSRIQAWAGSSVKRHARSPGPAITFR